MDHTLSYSLDDTDAHSEEGAVNVNGHRVRTTSEISSDGESYHGGTMGSVVPPFERAGSVSRCLFASLFVGLSVCLLACLDDNLKMSVLVLCICCAYNSKRHRSRS